jgi:flagellin-like hook-associated protein FlgL
MAVSGIGLGTSVVVQSAVDMRKQLEDLQRQLSSGKRTDSYAGLGLDRGLTVGLRAHLSSLTSYQQTITQVGVRLDIAQTALTEIARIGESAKTTAMVSQFALNGDNQTRDQKTIALQFDQLLDVLNTTTGDRYLFSGRSVDQRPVASAENILEGTAGKAGLKQLIAERRLADLGASGLGRLALTQPTATSLAIAEDAVSPFGFKLVGAVTSLTGTTITPPAGAPPLMSVDLGAVNPNDGETIRFTFTLPDGSTEDITLTATTTAPPGPNQFLIGVDTTATRDNLQTALTQALGTLAATALTAASAVAAADNFFNTDAANPPKRVAGPPFDTATALVNGTPANTVSWYVGEAGSDPARSTATVRADQSFTMNYGMRANEQALRRTVQSLAVFAAVTFSTTDPNADGSYAALQTRVTGALVGPQGQQSIDDIMGELAGVQTALKSSDDRHQQTTGTLEGLLEQVEGVSSEEVAAKILALQTSLQATLQTTALLLQTSILDYI